ncbi:hypothetical protein HPB48_011867 [Haemaphysalis longicornis]|uniref:Uncharacterized protein n=1 Tax=Haemaphysalis longicornis TaxID=44386 RepID=A0A9J6FJG0_HAELO|nr:hypothetical protein HPB48_011867 [Haemaphysalis longicornis]
MEDCLTRSKSHREDADDSTQKFCQALCQTGIPLHQTDGPLGSLFQDKCPAARTMPSSTQMYRKYLPEVYEHDLETIKEAVKNHPISLTIDKTPELCGRPAVAVLVTFYDDEVPGCRTLMADLQVLQQRNAVYIGMLIQGSSKTCEVPQ